MGRDEVDCGRNLQYVFRRTEKSENCVRKIVEILSSIFKINTCQSVPSVLSFLIVICKKILVLSKEERAKRPEGGARQR
jgi:hypothetical protein